MASVVVFKVKYEDTLRRFNAQVAENRLLDLDIAGLRAKIRSLFNFPADADLKLTYVDEDHDMVDLVDEADLHDVVKQALDPVRITVKLNTTKAASAASSGFSTPLRPQGQTSNLDLNASFADLLKSVPQPLRESLSKISAEAASKAASSSPMLADLVESFTKLAQSLNTNPTPHSAPADPAGETAPGSNGAEASDAVNAIKTVQSAALPTHVNWPMRDRKNLLMQDRECRRLLMQDLECRHRSQRDERKKAGLLGGYCVKGREKGSSSGQEAAVPVSSKLLQDVPMTTLPSPWFQTAQHGPVFHKGVQCDVCGAHPIIGPRFKSKVKEDYDLCVSCFKLTGNDDDYERMDVAASPRCPWGFKGYRAGHHPWAHPHRPLQPLFPVSGKQKPVRPKLDSRFISDVNVMDGTVVAPKATFTKIWRMRNSGNIPWVTGFQLVWIGGDKFSNTDSVQIQLPAGGYLLPDGEVEIAVDFTAPELPGRYISYWKVAAPSGLKIGQRVWVLIQVDATIKDTSSAAPGGLNLNLPPQAVPGDSSPEATAKNDEPLVDFQYEPAPVDELPNTLNLPEDGCYFFPPLPASYPMYEEPMPEPSPVIKPFASPANYTPLYPTVDPLSRSLFHPSLTAAYPMADPSPPATTSAVAPPATTDVAVGAAAAQAAAIDVTVGKSAPPESSSSGHNAVPKGQPIPVEVSGHNVNVEEEALLNELSEMGFKQTNLNKLVLKRNDYDLGLSLDELCNASEWDLLLEELQGMGFVDREMNEKALAKNNGSIKHAVMDLISRENK